MVLGYELHNFMFDTARTGHENTYDTRVDHGRTFCLILQELAMKILTTIVKICIFKPNPSSPRLQARFSAQILHILNWEDTQNSFHARLPKTYLHTFSSLKFSVSII